MPYIQYVNKKIGADKQAIIIVCNRIIKSYQAQGFRLTLRQLYYRLVAGDLFPDDRKWVWTGSKWIRHPEGTKNAEPNYHYLGDVVSDARLLGLMDWDAIEDRTRSLGVNSHWDTPINIIESARDSYLNDLWRWQPIRPEVWVEKDALEGVVQAACKPLDVPYFSCRGYTSQSAMWEAGQRLLGHRREAVQYEGKHKRAGGNEFRQRVMIFHLGDHDPSGIDMTRDITDRLELFTGDRVEVRRLALNMDQVQKYNPPPNPAKQTDSRFRQYMEEHGDESWELDALEPNVLISLIQTNIKSVMDIPRYEEARLIQEHGRKELTAIAKRYEAAIAAAMAKKR